MPVGRHPVEVPHLAPQAGALAALLRDGLSGGRRGLLPRVIGARAVSRKTHLRRKTCDDTVRSDDQGYLERISELFPAQD